MSHLRVVGEEHDRPSGSPWDREQFEYLTLVAEATGRAAIEMLDALARRDYDLSIRVLRKLESIGELARSRRCEMEALRG